MERFKSHKGTRIVELSHCRFAVQFPLFFKSSRQQYREIPLEEN